MLFATYNAPAPPRQNNILLIVLGVCGGCCLLVVIAGAIFMFTIGNKVKKGFGAVGGIFSGAMTMSKTMPVFLTHLKAHDYKSAAALVDTDYQTTLSADKIKAIEEKVEKTLGPLQSFPTSPTGQTSNTSASPSGKELQSMEYVYTYQMTYKKGTATATFHFKAKDMSKFSGLVTDFKIEPDGQ